MKVWKLLVAGVVSFAGMIWLAAKIIKAVWTG